MGKLKITVAALVFLSATPAAADPIDRWRSYTEEASARCGIPVEWIEHVMGAESGGQTMLDGRPMVSRAGAMGLMQLMPGTWTDMQERLGLGSDPHHPRDNILAGACYLRLMYDRFGYPGLFAAYNAGPARYADYLAGHKRLPGETRVYLATVGGVVERSKQGRAMQPRKDAIFFALRQAARETATGEEQPSGLFMPLSSQTRRLLGE